MENERQLRGKNVLITGGANGIGLSIAKAFLKQRINNLAILDIAETAGIEAAKALTGEFKPNGEIVFVLCDVTKDDEIDSVYNDIFKRFGSIDVFVHGAGIFDEKNYKRCLDVNLYGVVNCTKKAFELMSREYGGNGGTVINIASIYGIRIDSYLPVYHATKFGVVAYSRSMGMNFHYERSGVRILILCPGFTISDLVPQRHNVKERLPNEAMLQNIGTLLDDIKDIMQTSDHVAYELVDIFSKGGNGSVWVVEESKPAYEQGL